MFLKNNYNFNRLLVYWCWCVHVYIKRDVEREVGKQRKMYILKFEQIEL